ncbi:c-type cytochrome [soil metagenome]
MRIDRIIVLVAAVAGLLHVASAAAQPAPPLQVVPDTMQQRVAACFACHGQEGRATNDGFFPRIAGKPSGYLFNQLVAFRDGRRKYVSMNELLRNLPDGYLQEIADYFSKVDLPYPSPQTTNASAAALTLGAALVRDGDAARGVPACAACHGAALTGVAPFVPGLLGVPRDYINSQLGAWRTGGRVARAPDCMAEIANKLSFEEIAAASTFLSSQAITDPHPRVAAAQPLPIDCGSVPR